MSRRIVVGGEGLPTRMASNKRIVVFPHVLSVSVIRRAPNRERAQVHVGRVRNG